MAEMTNPLQAPHAPKKNRRGRQKTTTALGLELLKEASAKLAREQAELGKTLADAAARRKYEARGAAVPAKPVEVAISRGIMQRISAVLASEGVCVRIKASPARQSSAWTDFEQIVINYEPTDDVRLLSAMLRSFGYHEGGHCRFTVPFPDLADMAGERAERALHFAWNVLEDQRMETAVVSDSPRKATYLTVMVMTDMTKDVNAAAANWPLLIWRRYLPQSIRAGARKLFVVKHNAQGLDGEAIARRLEEITNRYVLADDAKVMWTAILDMADMLNIILPPAVKLDDSNMGHHAQKSKPMEIDENTLVIPIDPRMLVEQDEQPVDEDPPLSSDDLSPEEIRHLVEILIAAWNHPETLVKVVYAAPAGSGEQDEPGGEEDDEPQHGPRSLAPEQDDAENVPSPSQPEPEQDDEPAEAGYGDEDEDEDEDEAPADDFDNDWNEYEPKDEEPEQGEADGESDHDDANESANEDDDDDESTSGGESGENDNTGTTEADDYTEPEPADELTNDDLAKALADAEDARDNDPALNDDVDSFNQAIEDRRSNLEPYNGAPTNDRMAVMEAEGLASELEESFKASTISKAPQWVEQQRRGVLNVQRYATRQAGDTEVFRQWMDDDAPGLDMAVSVLLDYSSSMSGSVRELAQCGYACKMACDKLEIPCTVLLWDTGATVLWDANEPITDMPIINAVGGTDPNPALADLDNQRGDKQQHLVIIMTDGEWGGFMNSAGCLAPYHQPGRIICGAGFKRGNYAKAQRYADKLNSYGCDESWAVTDLLAIPRLLEQTLVAHA